MNTHQHTRIAYAPTSGDPVQVHVTLAGPCINEASTKHQWQRPVSVEIAYRSVVATKVMPPKAGDKFVAETFTPAQMIAAVKAERVAYHFAPGREKIQGAGAFGKTQKQIDFENRILAALVGEMSANQMHAAIGSLTASISTVLSRMTDEGRVTRRQIAGKSRSRDRTGLVNMYRRAAILETTEVTP